MVISSSADIINGRMQTRSLAEQVGFDSRDATVIATAVSELARNIVLHAGRGELVVEVIDAPQQGIRITASDNGPGIANVELALQARYSTGDGLGLGLTAVQKAVDTLAIEQRNGRGTTVIAHKWLERKIPV